MKFRQHLKDGIISLGIFAATFITNFLLEKIFRTQTMIPMIFVLGVFLISWRTQGFFWGILASVVSVLAVNYAFTYPYYRFDLISPECLSSVIVMLIVSILTGMLTTQIKHQEKMRVDAEQERMRAGLLRAVSHDLRTPLTSIYGATSVVIENYDSLSEEKKIELLTDVQTDSKWLIRMVENLLSVTRIDGQRVQLKKTPTVLEELIDTVLVKFGKHFPDRSVLVELPDDFVMIPMDAMLIEQVLFNLLENAAIHGQGMKELVLSVSCDRTTAHFSVRDDGCGIAPDRMEQLFTGYLERHELRSDDRRSNMGIGLSVCADIIKAHGGEIRARNLKPHGVEFYFSLKLEDHYEQQPV